MSGIQTSSPIVLSPRSAQTWAHFLRRLQARGGLARELAERSAASIMCALEQRLLGNEAADLAAQLPARLRELMQRCDLHRGPAPTRFGRDEFLQMVADDLDVDLEEAEVLADIVFETVRDWITDGEVEDVSAQLPDDLRTLWAPAP